MLLKMEAIVKKDELQKYNGKEVRSVYISYKGNIYVYLSGVDRTET